MLQVKDLLALMKLLGIKVMLFSRRYPGNHHTLNLLIANDNYTAGQQVLLGGGYSEGDTHGKPAGFAAEVSKAIGVPLKELEAYPLNPPTTVVSGADARLKVVVLPAAATEASLDNLFITRLAAKSHSLVVDGAADPIFTSGRHAVSLADAGRRSCLAVSKMSAPRRQFEIST